MKKLILLSFCGFCMLCSCKKNVSLLGTSAISAVANGSAITFNTNSFASLTNNGNAYGLVITGAAGTSATASQITIVVDSLPSPPAAGTYSPAGTFATRVSIIYSTSNNLEYSNDTAHASYQPEVTITSISNTNVQGTFSGNLILYTNRIGPVTQNISNGKFNVSIQQ